MRLYNFLLYLILPFALLRLLLRSRRLPAYRRRIGERFGRFQALESADSIWVHAVSVGEVQAASELVRRLAELFPGSRIVITTSTPTGADRVRKLFGDAVIHRFMPFDLPFAVRAFLRLTKPRLLVIMETEIWPNMIGECSKQAIPVLLANARMSARSAKRYRLFSRLIATSLSRLSAIACSSDADRNRLIELGADANTAETTGNLKFDLATPRSVRESGEALRLQIGQSRPVWIAGSTHEGEEGKVLKAHQKIRQQLPEALLILVPRHPDRFDRVYQLCRQRDQRVVRRSKTAFPARDVSVYLADTMGELPMLFTASDVAFVGGSLESVGGHNLLEPAAAGCPVLVGPHTFNFESVTRNLIEAKGARRIADEQELALQVGELLADSVKRGELSHAAYQFVEANRGALGATEKLVRQITSPSAGSVQ